MIFAAASVSLLHPEPQESVHASSDLDLTGLTGRSKTDGLRLLLRTRRRRTRDCPRRVEHVQAITSAPGKWADGERVRHCLTKAKHRLACPIRTIPRPHQVAPHLLALRPPAPPQRAVAGVKGVQRRSQHWRGGSLFWSRMRAGHDPEGAKRRTQLTRFEPPSRHRALRADEVNNPVTGSRMAGEGC